MKGLVLEEESSPREIGTTLHAEPAISGPEVVYLNICPTGDDPETNGMDIYLRRDAAVQLRDYITDLLAT